MGSNKKKKASSRTEVLALSGDVLDGDIASVFSNTNA
jgi:hypothetical protein